MKLPASDALVGALRNPTYEVIPLAGVEETVAGLPAHIRLTVTSSTSWGVNHTVDVAGRLADMGFNVVPHVAARLVADHDHLSELTAKMGARGIREVFVIGGDAAEPAGRFGGALDLLEALSTLSARSELGTSLDEVGIAGYPEPHPFIPDDVLIQSLWDKRGFATYMASQMCFDAATLRRWIAGLRARGISLPLEIGVPGVAPLPKLLRISAKIGVGESVRFLRGNRGLVKALAGPRTYRPDRLLAGLEPDVGEEGRGVRGFHFYTFNEVARTEEWRQRTLRRLASPMTA